MVTPKMIQKLLGIGLQVGILSRPVTYMLVLSVVATTVYKSWTRDEWPELRTEVGTIQERRAICSRRLSETTSRSMELEKEYVLVDAGAKLGNTLNFAVRDPILYSAPEAQEFAAKVEREYGPILLLAARLVKQDRLRGSMAWLGIGNILMLRAAADNRWDDAILYTSATVAATRLPADQSAALDQHGYIARRLQLYNTVARMHYFRPDIESCRHIVALLDECRASDRIPTQYDLAAQTDMLLTIKSPVGVLGAALSGNPSERYNSYNMLDYAATSSWVAGRVLDHVVKNKHTSFLKWAQADPLFAGISQRTIAALAFGSSNPSSRSSQATWLTVVEHFRELRLHSRMVQATYLARIKFLSTGEWPESLEELAGCGLAPLAAGTKGSHDADRLVPQELEIADLDYGVTGTLNSVLDQGAPVMYDIRMWQGNYNYKNISCYVANNPVDAAQLTVKGLNQLLSRDYSINLIKVSSSWALNTPATGGTAIELTPSEAKFTEATAEFLAWGKPSAQSSTAKTYPPGTYRLEYQPIAGRHTKVWCVSAPWSLWIPTTGVPLRLGYVAVGD